MVCYFRSELVNRFMIKKAYLPRISHKGRFLSHGEDPTTQSDTSIKDSMVNSFWTLSSQLEIHS